MTWYPFTLVPKTSAKVTNNSSLPRVSKPIIISWFGWDSMISMTSPVAFSCWNYIDKETITLEGNIKWGAQNVVSK